MKPIAMEIMETINLKIIKIKWQNYNTQSPKTITVLMINKNQSKKEKRMIKNFENGQTTTEYLTDLDKWKESVSTFLTDMTTFVSLTKLQFHFH